MILYVICSVLKVSIPFREVTPQQVLDQRLKVLVKAFGISRLGVDNFSVDVHRIVILEWRVASEHFIEQDAQSPPINSKTMTLIKQYFWRDILGRSANRIRTFLDDLRESEIDHLQITVRANHNVLWFQVPVYDLLTLKILENGNNLASVELCLFGIEVSDSSVIGEKIATL